MEIPEGWKLVPIDPTPIMLDACKRALKRYLDAMPEAERVLRFGKKGAHGHRVDPGIKAAVRYRAMLDAAPSVSGPCKAANEPECSWPMCNC